MCTAATRPIIKPNNNDILKGRGNGVQYHVGNIKFREMVKNHKIEYQCADRKDKPRLCTMIYRQIKIQEPPGRFLEQDPETKLWYQIEKSKALFKIGQALREREKNKRSDFLLTQEGPNVTSTPETVISGINTLQETHSFPENVLLNEKQILDREGRVYTIPSISTPDLYKCSLPSEIKRLY